MTRRPRQATNQESRFGIDELFFSTTDRFGKIRSGNEVFRRVAKYSLPDMLGEAHSLVRHPDMPRAAFALLWDYLQAGHAVAAYVKNMASDGSFYWVVATVVPIPGEDGFLSVRLKPSSKVFPIVERAYAALRAIELEHEMAGDRAAGLEASVAALPGLLRGLGFATYDDFMHAMLPLEVRQRDAALGDQDGATEGATGGVQPAFTTALHACARVQAGLRRQFALLDDFVSLSQMLDEKSRFVDTLASSVRLIALNATSRSARLARSGAGISVVSNAIGDIAQSAGALAKQIGERNAAAVRDLQRAAFQTGIARLQLDMARSFLEELALRDDADHVAEDGLRALVGALGASVGGFFEAYASVVRRLQPVRDHIDDLHRLVRMLEVTHVTGRMEASQLSSPDVFEDYFQAMSRQVEQARAELGEFGATVGRIARELKALGALERDVNAGLAALAVTSRGAGLVSVAP